MLSIPPVHLPPPVFLRCSKQWLLFDVRSKAELSDCVFIWGLITALWPWFVSVWFRMIINLPGKASRGWRCPGLCTDMSRIIQKFMYHPLFWLNLYPLKVPTCAVFRGRRRILEGKDVVWDSAKERNWGCVLGCWWHDTGSWALVHQQLVT